MLPVLFIVGMFILFGKIAGLALRGAWGITKILFGLVFLPFFLIGLALKGLIMVALPILVIAFVISIFNEA